MVINNHCRISVSAATQKILPSVLAASFDGIISAIVFESELTDVSLQKTSTYFVYLRLFLFLKKTF